MSYLLKSFNLPSLLLAFAFVIIAYVDKNYLIIMLPFMWFAIFRPHKSAVIFFITMSIALFAYYMDKLHFAEYIYLNTSNYFNVQIIHWSFYSLIILFLFGCIELKHFSYVENALKLSTNFFAIAIIIQTVTHYSIGDVDLYQMFGGSEPQRAYDGGLYRPGAFFLEPGTYGIFVGPLVLAHSYMIKKVDSRNILPIVSLLLTFSSFAHYYTIASIMLAYKKDMLNSPKSLLLFIFLALVLIAPSLMFNFERFSSFDDSTGTLAKKVYAYKYLSWQSPERIISGIGLGRNDCLCLYADTSLWFSLFYIFGVWAVVVFVILFVYSKIKNGLDFALLIPFFTKIEFHHPLLWVYLLLIVYIRSNDNLIRGS